MGKSNPKKLVTIQPFTINRHGFIFTGKGSARFFKRTPGYQTVPSIASACSG